MSIIPFPPRPDYGLMACQRIAELEALVYRQRDLIAVMESRISDLEFVLSKVRYMEMGKPSC